MIAAVVVLSLVVLALLSVPVIVVRDWVHEREQKRAILAWVNRHADPETAESAPDPSVRTSRGHVPVPAVSRVS